MMMGGGTPEKGVAAAHLFRAGRDQSPGGSSSAGAGGNIDNRQGKHTGGEADQATGAMASSPSSRSVWKQRRLSLRPTERAARLGPRRSLTLR